MNRMFAMFDDEGLIVVEGAQTYEDVYAKKFQSVQWIFTEEGLTEFVAKATQLLEEMK